MKPHANRNMHARLVTQTNTIQQVDRDIGADSRSREGAGLIRSVKSEHKVKQKLLHVIKTSKLAPPRHPYPYHNSVACAAYCQAFLPLGNIVVLLPDRREVLHLIGKHSSTYKQESE